jgi:hypothetical protein
MCKGQRRCSYRAQGHSWSFGGLKRRFSQTQTESGPEMSSVALNSLANLNLYEHVGRYADAAGNDRKVL